MKNQDRQHSTVSTLSPKQLEIIEAIARGATKSSAAEAAGIDRTTIYVWLKKDPDFRAQLDLARVDYEVELRAKHRHLAEIAHQTVADILQDPKIPPGLRLRAASIAIQHAEPIDYSRREGAILELSRRRSGPLQRIVDQLP